LLLFNIDDIDCSWNIQLATAAYSIQSHYNQQLPSGDHYSCILKS